MPSQNEWDADIALDADTARDVLEAQFPAVFSPLAPARVTLLPAGWDNHVFLVNDEWVFRFPRREIAVRFLAYEQECLPALAAHLPLPVPVPAMLGSATAGFPRAFFGYRVLAGTTACRADLTPAQRAACAQPLGDFLRSLHALSPSIELPPGFIHRADVRRRAGPMRERVLALSGEPGLDVDALVAVIDEAAAATPWDGRAVPCHGDLYARHVLVDEGLRPCGIIDWGDVHGGDRAVDLGVAWSFLPAAARQEFRAAYGPLDADTWARARYRAVHYGVHLLRYGRAEGDEAILRASAWAFEGALA